MPSLSSKRDLRTGRPLWLPGAGPRFRFSTVRDGLTVDVAVVGGGVSGALMTDALLMAGLKVAVFDRRGLVRGSTPASTALLQFELDTPLTVLAKSVGMEKAARVWWRSAQAVASLAGRIEDLGIACDLIMRNTCYLPGDVLGVRALGEEAKARRRIGLRSELIDAAAVRRQTGIDAPAAIWSAGSAQLDPVKLTAGLWRSCIARGASMHAPVEIAQVRAGARGVSLVTDAGKTVRAAHCVMATGYELPEAKLPEGFGVASTWAMATVAQARRPWASRALIWQAADPYLYMRTTPDDRVIVGGEDEEFSDEASRDALIPEKIAAIRAKLSKLMPGLRTEPEFAWAGCFGTSPTGMPAIGEIPGWPRCHGVAGFGGNGITFSMIGAQMIRNAIIGVADPDAAVFAWD